LFKTVTLAPNTLAAEFIMCLATNTGIMCLLISTDLMCLGYTLGLVHNPYFIVAPLPPATTLIPSWLHWLFWPILAEKQTFYPVMWMILSAIKRFSESIVSDSTPSRPVRMSCQCDGGATRCGRGRGKSLFCPTRQCMATSHTTFQSSKASSDISPRPLL